MIPTDHHARYNADISTPLLYVLHHRTWKQGAVDTANVIVKRLGEEN